jgi:hypothetical protein
MHLVSRAKALFEAQARAAGLPPSLLADEPSRRAGARQRQRLAHRGLADKLGGFRRECGTRICQDPAPLHAAFPPVPSPRRDRMAVAPPYNAGVWPMAAQTFGHMLDDTPHLRALGRACRTKDGNNRVPLAT